MRVFLLDATLELMKRRFAAGIDKNRDQLRAGFVGAVLTNG